MKYLKAYEEITEIFYNRKTWKYEKQKLSEIKIGDYVICQANFQSENTNNIVRDSIGKLVNISNDKSFQYKIEYGIFGKSGINYDIFSFSDIEIIAFSPNKEELKIYLKSNKYNL